MENKSGLRIVGKNGALDKSPGPDENALGATGFYYVTPSDWDDGSLSGRRVYTRLVTLPSYIFRELVKGVILATAVFSVILMAVFAGQVMRDGIGPYTLLKVLPNFLPLICPFVLPLAIITGILICYSRLARDNEILAAYAGGVNPLWLMLPAILTSVLSIFVTLALNERGLLPAISNIERLVIEDQKNILRRMVSRPGNITVQTGNEYMAMSKLDTSRDPQGRAALDITRFATEQPTGDADKFPWDPRYYFPTKRVVARDHEIQEFTDTGPNENVLKMHVSKPVFQDLHATDINRTFIADGESGEERIVLAGRPNVTINSRRSSFWPIMELSKDRRILENRLRESLEVSDSQLAEFSPEQQHRIVNDRSQWERQIRNRTSEVHMRLALCFSCLAFAVLGIPLGMRSRGTMVSSFVIGIATAGIYFLALKSAEGQVARGLMPYWVIWIPDVVVVLLGIILWFWSMRRA